MNLMPFGAAVAWCNPTWEWLVLDSGGQIFHDRRRVSRRENSVAYRGKAVGCLPFRWGKGLQHRGARHVRLADAVGPLQHVSGGFRVVEGGGDGPVGAPAHSNEALVEGQYFF